MLLVILAGSLLLRVSSLVGNHLQVDEPRWMVRGLFLVEALFEGDLERLQTEHWTGSIRPGLSRLSAGLATGTMTALGAGAGMQVEKHLLSSSQSTPFRKIFLARAFSALLSGLTPLLVFLLLRRFLAEPGALAAAAFLMFEPVVHYWGGMAHLEAFLTLASPLSLLLYELSRRHGSTALLVAAGAIFGMAFATRANAAVVFLTLLLYSATRLCMESRKGDGLGSRLLREGRRLLVFGGVGWLVFVLLYPPIWQLPLRGFLAFVKVYLDSTGAASSGRLGPMDWLAAHSWPAWLFLGLGLAGLLNRTIRREPIFQLGGICYVMSFLVLILPASFHARYLSSVMPSLALTGAVSLSVLWDRYGVHSRGGFRVISRVLGGLTLLICATTLVRAWESNRSTHQVYGQLQALQFSEVHFPVRKVKFVRTGGQPGGKRLFVTSRDSTPGLAAVYLDIILTDQGKLQRIGPGWERVRQEEGARCGQGDWEYGSWRAGERPTDQQPVGYRRLYIGRCG